MLLRGVPPVHGKRARQVERAGRDPPSDGRFFLPNPLLRQQGLNLRDAGVEKAMNVRKVGF